MKALVKKSIVFMLVSLFTIGISAQRPDKKARVTPEERASKQTEIMAKQLELTEEQQAKVKEINLKYSQQTANHEQQAKDELKKSREDFKSLFEAKDAELKQVLTPEQYQKWQEKRKDLRKNFEGKFKKHDKIKE
jgi:Spy/CpxP family protein refolding chaperone